MAGKNILGRCDCDRCHTLYAKKLSIDLTFSGIVLCACQTPSPQSAYFGTVNGVFTLPRSDLLLYVFRLTLPNEITVNEYVDPCINPVLYGIMDLTVSLQCLGSDGILVEMDVISGLRGRIFAGLAASIYDPFVNFQSCAAGDGGEGGTCTISW